MTGLDMVSGSLRLIGVLAAGETPTATEANQGLQSLNDMFGSWSTQRLTIYTVIRETFNLVANQQTYTFGSGGDFNSARPMKIENALVQIPGTMTPVVEIPMKILNKDQYAGQIVKGLTSTFPLYLYNDDAYPNANISVWPVPNATCTIALYSVKPLTQIATLSTAITLPQGYNEAIKYNLAVRLAPEYGRQPSQLVIDIAESSLGNIKRMNSKPLYLIVDPALISAPAVFNWYTGEPT